MNCPHCGREIKVFGETHYLDEEDIKRMSAEADKNMRRIEAMIARQPLTDRPWFWPVAVVAFGIVVIIAVELTK